MSAFDGRGDSSSSTEISSATIGQNPGTSGDTVPASTATTFSIAPGGTAIGYVNTSEALELFIFRHPDSEFAGDRLGDRGR